MRNIGFIGAGVVGTALAVKLAEKGYRVTGVFSRSRSSAEKFAAAVKDCSVYDNAQALADVSDMVFITTPDDSIPQVVSPIKWHFGQSVVHCSGADSTEILAPAADMGAAVGAFHPLQTFAGIRQAIDNLSGSTFAIEAKEPLLSTLTEMALALGGNPIALEAGDKAAYHTAAVMTSNYLVTLVKMAADLWQSFGIPPQEATKALLPLLKGTLRNLETRGIPQALTGPIARGDIGTVTMHLETLKNIAPSILSAYCELGLQTIPIALAKGRIAQNQADELEAVLKEYRETATVEGENYAYHVKK